MEAQTSNPKAQSPKPKAWTVNRKPTLGGHYMLLKFPPGRKVAVGELVQDELAMSSMIVKY